MKRIGILGKLLIFSLSMTVISFVLIIILFNNSFTGFTEYVLEKSEKLLIEKYEYQLKSATQVGSSLMETIYKMNNLNERQKLDMARKMIRPLRFGIDGYYFVYQLGTGINLIHGATPKLEGEYLWNMQDPNKQYIIRELDKVATEKTMFHKYIWSKPGSEGLFPKLGTAAIIPGTYMWIGTGEYIDEIENNKKILARNVREMAGRSRINFILGFIGIGIAAVLIIIFGSRSQINPIKNMIHSSKEISEGNYDVKIETKTMDEIGELAKNFNDMARKLKTYTNNLENMVSDRTRDLQDTMNKLHESNEILEGLSEKLSRYLSPQIRDSIFTGKQNGKIESKRKKLTVFFSDIRNFTQTTERLETEDLTGLLNNYLDEMSGIALKHGATIDKYVGDAIMVFFGDPESRGQKEDAEACLAMGLEMRSRIRELQHEWRDQGITEPFHVRMGINTGYCTVGNFGSMERMDYTIIGSQVNLAARLESAADPDEINISHETFSLVKDRIFCEKKDKISVKGISHEIQMYRVVDYHDNVDKLSHIVEEDIEGFKLSVDLSQISRDERKRMLKTLRDTFYKIKGKKLGE